MKENKKTSEVKDGKARLVIQKNHGALRVPPWLKLD